MPLYEFRCHTCGQITELMMKLSDPAPSACACGATNSMEKIISKTSFVLKGTGWYETDFKKSSASSSKSSSYSPPSSEPSTTQAPKETSSSAETPAAPTSESKPHNCTGGGCH